jgi:hypothetical protein
MKKKKCVVARPIRIGDKVIVSRSPAKGEKTKAAWLRPQMSRCVGRKFEVKEVSKLGVRLSGEKYGLYFPPFVLRHSSNR